MKAVKTVNLLVEKKAVEKVVRLAV